jgi:hypothetical protein
METLQDELDRKIRDGDSWEVCVDQSSQAKKTCRDRQATSYVLSFVLHCGMFE